MPLTYTAGRTSFGLLPEPEGEALSFATSAVVINLAILATVLLITGMTAGRPNPASPANRWSC